MRICTIIPEVIHSHHHRGLTAIYDAQKLWDVGSDITVSFMNKGEGIPWTPIDTLKHGTDPSNTTEKLLDPLETVVRKLSSVDAVKKVITERIIPIVNLNIKFVKAGGDIRIKFEQRAGSYSMIGTDCFTQEPGKNTVNYGWLDVGTITHEFLHSLGALHEHQNPFGHTIDWNLPKLYVWAEHTFGWDKSTVDVNIVNRYKTNTLNGSDYDDQSIMLYFYPAGVTEDGKAVRMNHRLSSTDVLWISKSYPKDGFDPKEFYESIYPGSEYKPIGGVHIAPLHHYYLLIGFGLIILMIGMWMFRGKGNGKIRED
jgi:hypothetical protein